jgi:O-succinylbenzoic acid--CoA ligase
MPQGEGAAHPGSVGRAVPCGELRVMDAAGREVTPGESGEIWIGGPMVVPGYWQREAATRAEFAAGFWKSGDIGSVDADGYVYIFDRKKDMINRGGFKIYPAELESALAAMEGVVEAAIVGRPDPVLGEAVVAFLTTERDDMTPETVRAWCAARMADYKVPGEVVIGRFPLPRNANGTLQKAELRALLGGRQAAPAGLGL